MPTTATQKLTAKKEAKKVVLDADFGGMKRGQVMFVATPKIVADYVARIPSGETRTIPRMRLDMARRRQCDSSCPISTAMFIRIVGQAACEQMEAGKPPADVTPFWRLVSPEDKVVEKLSIEPSWIDKQRALERTNSGVAR